MSAPASTPPVVILDQPQLGQNIGMAARAMANCALPDLRLVAPRDGWPNSHAWDAAAGATGILDAATVHDDLGDALADLTRVYATSIRQRETVKPTVTPKRAAEELREAGGMGETTGLLFGPERTGLTNWAMTHADAVLTVPLNPDFPSLNLAQAVLLVGYEWWQLGDTSPMRTLASTGAGPRATKADLENFYGRLEGALADAGFYTDDAKRPLVQRQVRNIFARTGLTRAEVNTLHGIVSALLRLPKGAPPVRRDDGDGEG